MNTDQDNKVTGSEPAHSDPPVLRVTVWLLLLTLFDAGDLLDAARVAAALELGLQPDAYHALDLLLAEQIGGQAHHVGVDVTAAHLGGDGVVTGGGADA